MTYHEISKSQESLPVMNSNPSTLKFQRDQTRSQFKEKMDKIRDTLDTKKAQNKVHEQSIKDKFAMNYTKVRLRNNRFAQSFGEPFMQQSI